MDHYTYQSGQDLRGQNRGGAKTRRQSLARKQIPHDVRCGVDRYEDVAECLIRACQNVTPDMVTGLQDAASLVDAGGRTELGCLLRKCAASMAAIVEINVARLGKDLDGCGEIWLG